MANLVSTSKTALKALATLRDAAHHRLLGRMFRTTMVTGIQ